MQDLEQGTMVRDKWFHIYKEDGDITYQGHILDYLPPRLVLVQLFSWLDGRPTCQKLLEVTDYWNFYNTQEAMHEAWDLHVDTFHKAKDPKDNYMDKLGSPNWYHCSKEQHLHGINL